MLVSVLLSDYANGGPPRRRIEISRVYGHEVDDFSEAGRTHSYTKDQADFLLRRKAANSIGNILYTSRIIIDSMMGLRRRDKEISGYFFRSFSLMRCLPSIRLNNLKNEPEISLWRPPPRYWLFFSPIVFDKPAKPFNAKNFYSSHYHIHVHPTNFCL